MADTSLGTGKIRIAAAFIQRLFEAGAVTRVLFLVDRIALAGQTEDAFTDHLRDYPCHALRPGRGFNRAKRITIATLQTMIAEYGRRLVGSSEPTVATNCWCGALVLWCGAVEIGACESERTPCPA